MLACLKMWLKHIDNLHPQLSNKYKYVRSDTDTSYGKEYGAAHSSFRRHHCPQAQCRQVLRSRWEQAFRKSVQMIYAIDISGDRLHDVMVGTTNIEPINHQKFSPDEFSVRPCGFISGPVHSAGSVTLSCDRTAGVIGRYLVVQIMSAVSSELLTLCEVTLEGCKLALHRSKYNLYQSFCVQNPFNQAHAETLVTFHFC